MIALLSEDVLDQLPRDGLDSRDERRASLQLVLQATSRAHADPHTLVEGEPPWKGIRQDAYANAHRIKVEEDKPEPERGYYLHPELFNQPEELGVQWARHPELMRQIKETRLKKIEELKQRASNQ